MAVLKSPRNIKNKNRWVLTYCKTVTVKSPSLVKGRKPSLKQKKPLFSKPLIKAIYFFL